MFGFFLEPGGECALPGSDRDAAQRVAEAARRCRGRARVLLYVTPKLAGTSPSYPPEVRRVARAGRAELKRFDHVDLPPVTGRNPDQRRADFERLAAESRGQRRRLRLQHAVLRAAVAGRGPLYGWMWKVSGWSTRFGLWRHALGARFGGAPRRR